MTIRALVADDDRATTALLRGTLQGWGLDVVVADDGDEAWQAIQHDATIRMAVLDWGMPGLDGPAVCRLIRGDATRNHLHVMLLTARESRADLVNGLDAGADDFLSKPFDPEILHARVNVGLRVLKLQATLADRVVELEAALSRVKQLHGLLPICSYCKHVRTDDNYWEQVEHYVAQHSDLQFSHGICPNCYARVMAEMDGPKR
ncbi:MAG: response regulator transcription factor [Vicinamibacterales bacterium]